MQGVSVSNDAAAFRSAVDRVKNQDMNRAIVIALNRTADGVKAEAIRRIKATHKVADRELRKGFTVRRAYAGNLRSMVYASGRPLNLIGFGARQTRKGVTVNVKGSRKLIPGAFIATIRVPNAGEVRAVFERKFVSGHSGKRSGRFPIRGVTTVSVPGLFKRDIVSKAISGIATDRFRRELTSAVRFIVLNKGGDFTPPTL